MVLIFKALSITERQQKSPLTLLDYTEPSPASKELLVQTIAVAQNPIDWKQIDYDIGIPSLPWTNGADVAGIVHKVGRDVTKFRVGDRVISYMSRKTARHGAYQTYCLANEERTVKLPGLVSFEDGATIPLGYVTAAAGCVDALGVVLPRKGPLPRKSLGEPLLIWGGSSSVGSYAIQVAKLSGYTVLTTASPSNFDHVISLGADHVFDYHDVNVVDKIRATVGDKLARIYDAISEDGTTEAAVKCITSPTGGIVCVVQSVDPTLSTPKIKVVQTGAAAAAENPAIGMAVYGLLEEALHVTALKPNNVKVVPGGLLGVTSGLELGRQHKISGEKLVYRIADTRF